MLPSGAYGSKPLPPPPSQNDYYDTPPYVPDDEYFPSVPNVGPVPVAPYESGPWDPSYPAAPPPPTANYFTDDSFSFPSSFDQQPSSGLGEGFQPMRPPPTPPNFCAPPVESSFAPPASFQPPMTPERPPVPLQWDSQPLPPQPTPAPLPVTPQQPATPPVSHSNLPPLPSRAGREAGPSISLKKEPIAKQETSVSVIRPDRAARKPRALLSEDNRETKEEGLTNDPHLVKVQEHRDVVDDVQQRSRTPYKISFVNLPLPNVSPIYFAIPSNSGPGAGDINDYPNLLKHCDTTKLAYMDYSFPSESAHNRCGQASVEWRRLKEINPLAVFRSKDGALPSDVVQGGAADSPFLAVVSALASRDKYLGQFVPSNQGDWSGGAQEDAASNGAEAFCRNVFHFSFWKWGKWIEVIVDDRLPYLRGELAFARCRNPNEYWVPLLEKAYAKLYGSYQALDYCTVEDTILDLTGKSCLVLDLLTEGQDEPQFVWQRIANELQENSVLLCSIGREGEEHPRQTSQRFLVQPNGLLLGRPYQINRIVEHDNIPLIQLSSIWSIDFPWKGAWGPQSREMLGLRPKDIKKFKLQCGRMYYHDRTRPSTRLTDFHRRPGLQFWMTLHDFIKNFTNIYIAKPLKKLKNSGDCRIFGKWQKAGGSPVHSTWPDNPQYLLSVSQTEQVHVSLLQEDWRIFGRGASNEPKEAMHIGMMVLRVEENRVVKVHRIQHITALTTFTNYQECALSVTLTKGKYVLIPMTMKKLKQSVHPFYLRLWGRSISCKQLTREQPKKPLFSNRPSGVLTVEIVKGRNLVEAGLISCDPFAEVSVESTTKKTQSCKGTQDPDWNQQFIFFLKKPRKARLRISVWHDGVLTSTFMGQAQLELNDLLDASHGATYRTSLPLEARKKDEKQGREISGFVVLRLSYFGDTKKC